VSSHRERVLKCGRSLYSAARFRLSRSCRSRSLKTARRSDGAGSSTEAMLLAQVVIINNPSQRQRCIRVELFDGVEIGPATAYRSGKSRASKGRL